LATVNGGPGDMADEQSRREQEDLNNRESPFFSLEDNHFNYIKKEQFDIPPTLVKDTYLTPDNSSIHVFEYDIPKSYFQHKGVYKCKSLFFSLLKKMHPLGRMKLHEKFLVVKFSERQEDDSLMHRDVVVENLLRNGVVFKGSEFNILGCSNSQVQKKSFVFMKGLQQDMGVAKRVKYTGLLFTGCRYMAKLPNDCHIKEVQDCTSNTKYNFTDGCGTISLCLAKNIIEENPELKKDLGGVIPTVWQIRYYGDGKLCKGVLVVDYSNKRDLTMNVRGSMVKLKIKQSHLRCLGIVDTSLKPRSGKLNKQFITLLSETVPREIMLGLQEDFLKTVKESRCNAKQAFKAAVSMHMWQTFKGILRKNGIKEIIPKNYVSLIQSIERIFLATLKKVGDNGSECEEYKSRLQIPLSNSRLMFGAAYPEVFKDLTEGQCIVITAL